MRKVLLSSRNVITLRKETRKREPHPDDVAGTGIDAVCAGTVAASASRDVEQLQRDHAQKQANKQERTNKQSSPLRYHLLMLDFL